MADAYTDIQRSILAYCNQFLTRNSVSGFDVYDFEAHAGTTDLPAKDLIGLAEYSIENLGGDMFDITCMIAVCTKSDDAGLERLRPVIGKLFKELKPGATGEKFPIVDDAGLKRGYLTVGEGVMVMPVGDTKTRPFQTIAVRFGAGYLNPPA